MFNLDTLNSLIALVTILLILSLIVQSLQGVLKKLLKIKSRQIEDSLIDLFENIIPGAKKSDRGLLGASPFLRSIAIGIDTSKYTVNHPDTQVRTLFQAVTQKFADLGRVAQSGKQMLNSLAKDDLLKVMEKVRATDILPAPGAGGANAFTSGAKTAWDAYTRLVNQLSALDGQLDQLTGAASAKYAAMRQALGPMLNDFKTLTSGGTLDPDAVVGDLLSLREIKFSDALGLLGEVQAAVKQDWAAAVAGSGTANTLKTLADSLTKLANALTDLRTEFDAALAPLRTRLREVETWYDTVMQSFSERYARGMRTWSIVIGFIVVVISNADFFQISRTVFTSAAVRNAIVNSQQQVLSTYQQEMAKAKADAVDPTKDQVSVNNAALQAKSLDNLVKEGQKDVQTEAELYSGYGFGWGSSASNALETPFHTIGGWLIMTILVSFGAPFWHDALESLFGVKNLLQQKTATKNVESQSGQGNPKT